MKIDEKVVSYFESSNSPVDKEGYLYKKGDIRPSYHKRWFVLKGNLLFYKDHPDDRDLIGVIVLEGCTVQLCESEEQFAFSLVWGQVGLRPSYKFAADDQAGQESWIKALLSANHGYLSLLVMDLEKKYKETLDALFSDPANGGAAAAAPNAVRQLSPQLSTLTRHPAGAAAAGAIAVPTLQTPAAPFKSTVKRSPKLWPKKTAHLTPIHGPAPPAGDCAAACSDTREDFSQMHDSFGKEIKELVADWSSRRAGRETLDENLIDLSCFE
ncbi:myosin regulatory light chain 2, skeletal muscle isoform X1 [Festucalex cinctus]